MTEEVKPSPPAVDGKAGEGAVTAAMGSTPAAAPSPTPTTTQPEQPAPGAADSNWEERYKGAMRVVSERDKQVAALQQSVGSSSTQVGDLTAQLEALRAQQTQLEATHATALEGLTGERDAAQTALDTAQAEVMKFQALKEHPELLPLADAIPALTDEQALTDYIEMMAKGVTDIATQKAQTLVAGMTPGAIAPDQQNPYRYQNLDEWQTALNQAAGTEDFTKIAAAFRQWEGSQN